MRFEPASPLSRVWVAGLVVLLAVACAPPRSARDALTVLLPSDVITLDPNRSVETVTDSVLFNVFEPLVGFDADCIAQTLLAESWEHPSPERWRFHLRRNVRFHDGTPLTAAQVRDGLVAVQRSAQHEASDFLSQVASIEAVDALTLDVVTREPRALLVNLPALYVAKPNAAGPFPPLVGTGPYRIKTREAGGRIVLERFAGYWGASPAFGIVAFVPVSDPEARLARLRGGGADVIYEVPPELARQTVAGARFLRRPSLTASYLGMDVRRRPGNPFADLRVRRALHLALDRSAIVERALLGAGEVSTQPVPPAAFGYNPDLPRPLPDLAQARRLLAEAGHAAGLAARLDFSRARLLEARLLKSQLEEVGVSLQLNQMEPHALFDLGKSGGSGLFLVGWSFSTGEASEFYEFCLHTPTPEYGFNNYGGYSNPEIDRIAEANAAVLDPRERRRMLERAAAVVMEELPVLPLYVEEDIYGVREGVTFQPRLDSEIRLLDVKRADGSGGE